MNILSRRIIVILKLAKNVCNSGPPVSNLIAVPDFYIHSVYFL